MPLLGFYYSESLYFCCYNQNNTRFRSNRQSCPFKAANLSSDTILTAIALLSQIHWSRLRSLLNLNKTLDERQSLLFPGRRTQAIVPGLEPFSEYRLTVSVYNKKGNGPNSDPVTFRTPEGGQ